MTFTPHNQPNHDRSAAARKANSPWRRSRTVDFDNPMICPACGGKLDYVPNGAGHIIHTNPIDAGCTFALPIGKMTHAEAREYWRELMSHSPSARPSTAAP